jgi:hypothetical protein
LWGERELKYSRLFQLDIQTTRWTELNPGAPLYLFVPQDADLLCEYERGWKLPDAMNQNGDPAPGIVTTQDEFAISWDSEDAKEKVRELLATASEEEARALFRLCSQSQWNYRRAKEELHNGAWKKRVKPILYRPFDLRWTVYDSNVAVHRRERVMAHMLSGENLGLSTTRSVEIGEGFQHVFCARTIIQHHTVSLKEVNFLFPLYLYPKGEGETTGQKTLTEKPTRSSRRQANLNPQFIADLEKRLGLSFVSDGKGDLKKTFGPEDVFNYIYAVFHSPAYRTRYAEFLKSDFPRVPLTSDLNLFRDLCAKGAELVALHLLESPKLEKPIARYPVKGPDLVDKGFPKYVSPGEPEPFLVAQGSPPSLAALPRLKEGRVYINKGDPQSEATGQYFEGVPPEVWNFHIGGYQVCEKWLKDRRGRTLTYDDLEHYCKVVTALSETIRLMAEIDAAIPKWPIE